METLENSELNQHVLYSMQRTSNALKAMGLDKSLQSVDKVMLELEENHNDVNSMQQTLGVGYGDDEDVDWGSELSLLLSDDCTSAPEVSNSMPLRPEQRLEVANSKQERPVRPEAAAAAAAELPEAAAEAELPEAAAEVADVKKAEPAVIE
jgi:hypothetical protein